MKNYIFLNGNKIELTAEQVTEMAKSLGIEQNKLSDIPVGETFKIGEYEFIVLEHSKETTAVILKFRQVLPERSLNIFLCPLTKCGLGLKAMVPLVVAQM